MPARKDSTLLVGSITCTAGIFLSGIFSVIFSILIMRKFDPSFMAVLGISGSLLYYFLQITCAGLPFAISAIVYRYWKKKDYRTVSYIRRIGFIFNGVFGVLFAVLFVAAGFMMPREIILSSDGSSVLITCMGIGAVCAILVHMVYGMRGFYQGIGRRKQDLISQLIECGAMILFIALLFLMNKENDPSAADTFSFILLAAVTFSLVLTLLYYLYFDQTKKQMLSDGARMQIIPAVRQRQVFKELFAFSAPCIVLAVLFYGIELATVLLMPFLAAAKYTPEVLRGICGIIPVSSEVILHASLMPAVFLSASFIPVIRLAFEKKDEKTINENMESAFSRYAYIVLPIVFTLCVLSPQCVRLFGNSSLAIEQGNLLVCAAVCAFLFGLAMITNWLMIALQFSKEAGFYSGVGLVIKIITMFLLVSQSGYEGALISSAIAYAVILFLNITKIRNYHPISLKRTYIRIAKMTVACLCMNGGYALLKYFGFNALGDDPIMAAVHFAAMIAAGVLIYLFVTNVMAVPKGIFHRNLGIPGRREKRK